MNLATFNQWLVKIFGSRNERLVRSYMQAALVAGDFESQMQALSDDQLKTKTAAFKEALAGGISPEQILIEAFAVVREAARRKLNMRHFDVQLVGGNVLYEGKIAEMSTGEGKTLVATLAAYLVHLTGRRVHVVTVNDYLAKRDAEWMGPVYETLGMTVGAIQADMDTTGDERRAQYACDITYGTNNEFGFDYLRDNMKVALEQMAQGPLEYAIIDEVDSILIDEARTPLIISGPAQDDVSKYKKADEVARHLINLQKQVITQTLHRLKDEDYSRQPEANKIIAAFRYDNYDIDEDSAEKINHFLYFVVSKKDKSANLTHDGIAAAQDFLGAGSFYTGSTMNWPHLITQSLRAHLVFKLGTNYEIIREKNENKIVIVDEFTGRLMHGRQWSDGLHQAVEAKENVQIKEESQTLATITLQNFFKLYGQIAGMTGTAATEADEFMKIYKLDVVTIPTNKPCVRDDREDMIYKSMREKFLAIVDEIHEVSCAGRPVLVGTVSIEKSEALSEALKRRHGIDHEVLNAKQHAREAVIVEKAGYQHTARDGSIRGNVTIATNMAGRGTDIKLGEGVARIGGLHILGTERHESRRIDNQLRGRAGRQGDPGSSVFFLSFDDELMRVFAPDWTVKALSMIGWEEGMPIQHARISKGIEKAQKKVEERNFEARKSLLEYDEVMDYQRKIFYSRRRKIIEGKDLKKTIQDMIGDVIHDAAEKILAPDYALRCLCEWAKTEFGVEIEPKRIHGADAEWIDEIIREQAKKNVANDISVSLGEYLEDYDDPKTWNLDTLCKWAMSAFKASLSASKLRQMTAEEIEEALTVAACEQVDKKSMVRMEEFLKEDYAARMFCVWAQGKFDLKINPQELQDCSPQQAKQKVADHVADLYRKREIEYPVEYAMNMVFGAQGPNVYAFEAMADWACRKYESSLTAEQLAEMQPKDIYAKLLEMSRAWDDNRITQMLESKLHACGSDTLAEWAEERFGTKLSPDVLKDKETASTVLFDTAKGFLRKELADLERFVLIQIFDTTWKDHLYAMDHLKESIMLRAYAEKDPKIEYKQEGFRMFNEMLETIEDRVTDIIFRVRLQAGQQSRSVYNVSQTQKQEVSQFEMSQRQRAAATAPQGEQKVKQIKLDQPKVGRNDPCPCGSGKKYKKCCGQPK